MFTPGKNQQREQAARNAQLERLARQGDAVATVMMANGYFKVDQNGHIIERGGINDIDVHTLAQMDSIYFGPSNNMLIFYDGTNGVIDTSLIAASDLLIKCGTDKTLKLQETVWNDINCEAFSMQAGASAPDVELILPSGNIRGLAFAGTGATVEATGTGSEVLHDYKEGTDVHFHVHWMPTTVAAGNVKWQINYSWANVNTVFAAPTLISTTQAAAGAAWTHQLAAITEVSGTSKNIGSHILFELFRDPGDVADTYAADAILLSVGIHYQIDTMGSRQIATK